MGHDVNIQVDAKSLRLAAMDLCRRTAERFVAKAKEAGIEGLELRMDQAGVTVTTSDRQAVAREFGTEADEPRPWVLPALQEVRR